MRRGVAFAALAAATAGMALVPTAVRAQQSIEGPGTPGMATFGHAGGVAGLVETGLGPAPFYSLKDNGADFVKAGVTTRLGLQVEPFVLGMPAAPGAIDSTWISWNWLLDGPPPPVDTIFVNGVALTGTLCGSGTPDLCWAKDGGASYVVQAPPGLVVHGGGNLIGAATDKPLGIDPGALGEGLTILTVYADPNEPMRLVDLWCGYTSTESDPTGASTATASLVFSSPYSGIGPAHFFLNGLDGQFCCDDLLINGVPASGIVAGTFAPGDAWAGLLGPNPTDNLYDHANDLIGAPFLTAGATGLFAQVVDLGDCVGDSFAAISFKCVRAKWTQLPHGIPSDCCVPHPTVGCQSTTCEQDVCAIDPFCCNIEWDQLCADEAAALCGDICPPPPLDSGFNVESDLDWQTLAKQPPGDPGPGPNLVTADDFQSNGNAITCVRWWGSYLDPAFEPNGFPQAATWPPVRRDDVRPEPVDGGTVMNIGTPPAAAAPPMSDQELAEWQALYERISSGDAQLDVPDGSAAPIGAPVLGPCGGANEGFETGAFPPWIAVDLAAPFFPLQVGPAGISPGFGLFTSAPTEGLFAALHGFDGNTPGTIIVAQDMAIPAGATNLLFDYRAGWDMFNFGGSTMNRTFTVEIEPAGGGPALQSTLFVNAMAGTVVLDTGDLTGTIPLFGFNGGTYRVSFEWFIPEPSTGPAFFQLDNIRCNVSCGAGGDCFNPHNEPGCEDVDCCKAVCAIDPFCCNTSWDGLCVQEAFDLCAGTEIDGWLISFHTDIPEDQNPNGPFSQPGELLGLYFCPAEDVQITPTQIIGWDGHLVYEYFAELRDCHLIHSYPDPRPDAEPVEPARPDGFFETYGFIYWLDVQAVVGHTYVHGFGGPLYGSDPQGGNLVTIDETTGLATVVGPFLGAAGNVTEIEWSPDGSTLYATTGGGNSFIHTIDPNTGAVLTAVPQTIFGALNGLEFDAAGTLLATFIPGPGTPSDLVTVDPNSGLVTPIGPTGFNNIGGLAYDAGCNTLYGITSGQSVPPVLLTLNTLTGQATPLANTTMQVEASSLEFDTVGRLIAGGSDGLLYEIAIPSGIATPIGPFVNAGKASGLSLRFGHCASSVWLEIETPNRADDPFWGWHTSPDAFLDNSVQGPVIMAGVDWLYPFWVPVDGAIHNLPRVDQGFQLFQEIDPCAEDCAVPEDDQVSVVDLLALLAQWGGPGSCDLDKNGMVDVVDLLDLLAAWGPCP